MLSKSTAYARLEEPAAAQLARRVRAPFRRQRKWDEHTLVLPSNPPSECSTLIEFDLDAFAHEDGCETEAMNDPEDYRLGADNRAWIVPVPAPAVRPLRARLSPKLPKALISTRRPPTVREDKAQLLDADNSAWM